jgi:hypothetical protein
MMNEEKLLTFGYLFGVYDCFGYNCKNFNEKWHDVKIEVIDDYIEFTLDGRKYQIKKVEDMIIRGISGNCYIDFVKTVMYEYYQNKNLKWEK